ncbi:DNA-processing protein DprA [Bradyrhizobium sp. NP1]|uniref:DNA-processing protein DprA n=1 Tax=Bradyrhizobium sp. NP1 TaxID=3049772 RepID=UPI0025A6703E|nr:DNA-processing protein DprA [Bradyrhizobium sp. NP1]WJR74940.1 DNA-processing protein DprA [Bradyrhizobium sp. NP1]
MTLLAWASKLARHRRIRRMPLPAASHTNEPPRRRAAYVPPTDAHSYSLPDLLVRIGRAALDERQLDFLRDASPRREAKVFYAGNLDILDAPTVSIVGTREVSDAGWRRASQLARDLVKAGVTVVSGLAKGVDTAALKSAMENGGRVAAVIGTPLDKAYPAENASLQQEIYSSHLLMTPFGVGERVFRSNFPTRNRVMAAISDATAIIEASDTSGTLHQAAECVRLGRWLFIAKSVVDDPSLTWPARFLGQPKVSVLSSTSDIISAIGQP